MSEVERLDKMCEILKKALKQAILNYRNALCVASCNRWTLSCEAISILLFASHITATKALTLATPLEIQKQHKLVLFSPEETQYRELIVSTMSQVECCQEMCKIIDTVLEEAMLNYKAALCETHCDSLIQSGYADAIVYNLKESCNIATKALDIAKVLEIQEQLPEHHTDFFLIQEKEPELLTTVFASVEDAYEKYLLKKCSRKLRMHTNNICNNDSSCNHSCCVNKRLRERISTSLVL